MKTFSHETRWGLENNLQYRKMAVTVFALFPTENSTQNMDIQFKHKDTVVALRKICFYIESHCSSSQKLLYVKLICHGSHHLKKVSPQQISLASNLCSVFALL